ncbi:DUF2599 domain-containing protein [Nocardia flavorosea]|uniref:DUF2599 domain-containing protein n=1 Tax=Nocardia flavorosea TaxID=53429 RepID=UPI001895503E|nr:DUF2599 domain-containing protein [Nocardia flavorosea]MBF6347790.1 DUF2599 domain-containing protein [Nocardia flavorosea]
MPADPTSRVAGSFALLCTALLAGCGPPDPREPAAATAAGSTTVVPEIPRPTATPATDVARSSTPVVDPYAGMPLIDRLAWTSTVDGPRLVVHPTRAGRDTTFPGAADRAWREINTLDPAADTPGMWDQFRCHWEWARLIAPDKPTWNLEPWRPPVGYDATVGAACNPGGPER